MSVSALTTVWCNGCGTWEDCGVGRNAKEARRTAKAAGWAVSVPGSIVPPLDPTARSLWVQGQPRDFCPRCKKEMT